MFETKKAIVLASMESVQNMAQEAQQVLELQKYASIPAIDPEAHSLLKQVETKNLLLAQEVAAQHNAVEALLLQYTRIIEGISKKFQLYDRMLTQLEQKKELLS
jgi:hypothetical protein